MHTSLFGDVAGTSWAGSPARAMPDTKREIVKLPAMIFIRPPLCRRELFVRLPKITPLAPLSIVDHDCSSSSRPSCGLWTPVQILARDHPARKFGRQCAHFVETSDLGLRQGKTSGGEIVFKLLRRLHTNDDAGDKRFRKDPGDRYARGAGVL